MIPPYGVRHRPVPIPPTWYDLSGRLAFGRPGRRRHRSGVCVDIERGLLGIRYRRWRLVTMLQNVAAVHLAGSGSPGGVRRSGRDGYLRLGDPSGPAVRVRFRRAVPTIHASGLHGRPVVGVIVGVHDADGLVEQLRGLPVEHEQQPVAEQHEQVQRVEPEGQRRHRTEDRQATEGQ